MLVRKEKKKVVSIPLIQIHNIKMERKELINRWTQL